MTSKQRELKLDYICGEWVSTAAMIKAGFFVETDATKMLTAQMHDQSLTSRERAQTRRRIERAGYVIEMTGNMKSSRVFEVTL